MRLRTGNRIRKRRNQRKHYVASRLRGVKLTIDAILKAAECLDEVAQYRREHDEKVMRAIMEMTPDEKDRLIELMARGFVSIDVQPVIVDNPDVKTSISLASDYDHEQVARFYNVPKSKLKDYPRATFHVNTTS